MRLNRPGGISPLLKYAPAGTYVTVEQLPHGGSLQARMLSTQAVQLYWRYALDDRTFREPIGGHDPSAAPKKMEPTPRGFSLAAARERCRELAMRHEQHRDDGGLRGAKLSAREAEVIFDRHVAEPWPGIAQAPASDLSQEQVVDMLRRLVEPGKGRTSNKLRTYLRAAYQCAIDVRVSASITVAFKAYGVQSNPVALTKRDRQFDSADQHPLTTDELRAYWRLIEKLPGLRGRCLRLHLLIRSPRGLRATWRRWIA